MSWDKIEKSGEFIHCPRCHSANILQTDYEIEDDDGDLVEDEDGRSCDDCGWEGDDSELVSIKED